MSLVASVFSHRRDLPAGGRVGQEAAETHFVHPGKQLSEVSLKGAAELRPPVALTVLLLSAECGQGGKGPSSKGKGPRR